MTKELVTHKPLKHDISSTITWDGRNGDPIPFEAIVDFSKMGREELEKLALSPVLITFRAALKRKCSNDGSIDEAAVRRVCKKKFVIDATNIADAADGLTPQERLKAQVSAMTPEQRAELAATLAALNVG